MKRAELAALCALAACGGDDQPASSVREPIVRDSAGITIVENLDPTWTPASAWRVDPMPVLDIGDSDDEGRQFSLIRGVHRMPSGPIAVLDVGSSSVRFFDERGALIGRAGRRGGGPGEFDQQVVNSFSCGADTVYVRLLRRVVVFAAPGRYVRQFEPPPLTSGLGCRGDRWLGHAMTGGWPSTAGTHRIRVELAWHDLNGRRITVIDSVPFEDQAWSYDSRRGWGYVPRDYGPRFAAAVGREGVAGGIGDPFEIQFWDAGGAARRIVRVQGRERPITQAEIDRYRAFILPRTASWNAASRRAIEDRLTAANLPRTLPAFAEMRFDEAGALWVREYDFADATAFWANQSAFLRGRAGHSEVHEGSRRWYVFDPIGRLLGEVAMPPRLEIREIGDDWILGVWRDELDVEHVRLHRLIKP